MEWVIFSKSNGCGYISKDNRIDSRFNKEPAQLCIGKIDPGQQTTLSNFFDRNVMYIGRDGAEMLFYLGCENSTHYYEAVFLISETKLFQLTKYQPSAGRDYNYVNNEWK